MNKIVLFIVSIVTSLSISAQAQLLSAQLSPEMKIKLQQEIDFIGNLYGSVYAPKTWKESHLGWNLPQQVSLAQQKLQAATHLRQARTAVADLINSTADYHVSFVFYSTEKSSLPFQVKSVAGQSIIVFIDRTKLSEAAFPFDLGDELISIDGVNVNALKSQMVSILGANVASTDEALADFYLTQRSGRANMIVPHGPSSIVVKKASDDTLNTVTLYWEYEAENLGRIANTKVGSTLLNKNMLGMKAYDFIADKKSENRFAIGNRNPFLPNLSERLWETPKENTFDAYIYQNEEGKLIGVVRIFSYSLTDYAKAVKDFSGIIQHFEKHTAAMVIDQNNNPGGSVFYLYTLASMMSDQSLRVPKHAVALTYAEASECIDTNKALENIKNDEDAVKSLGDLGGYTASYQLALGIKDYCNFVISEYKSGKALSSPYYLWGVDKITPNAIHYTKPVVLLVNQLDFSGGDFFPAIMQDNKRVTVVGTRTAGAGGYILEASFPNNLGLETVTFTGSIAERTNLNPIENLGITPDISLTMTANDLRKSFIDYLTELKTILKNVIK